MGFKITNLETPQGFSAEMAAGSTIAIVSSLGVSLSTTHTINTAIMGVGATRPLSAVRGDITFNIVAAWISLSYLRPNWLWRCLFLQQF